MNTLSFAALAILAVDGCGRSGASGGNSNNNADDNASLSFEQSVELDLSTNGSFEIADGVPVERRVLASIEDALGMNTLDAFAVRLDASDVEIVPAGTNGADSNGLITLDVLVGPADATDACTNGVSLGRFDLSVGTNGEVAVEPSQLELVPSALWVVSTGEFALCLRTASETDHSLTIARLFLLLNDTMPNLNCPEIFALTEVRDALDLLADEKLSFDLHRGSAPLNITGRYMVTHAVEFDPDGTDERDLPSRTDVFSDQAEGTVMRTSGRAEIEQFITGTDTAVSLCVLARTNNPDCDQTIARLESYEVSSNGVDLEGGFVAVVIQRHPSDDEVCGEAGDFIFGSITLTRQDTTAGPVPTNDNASENDNLGETSDPLGDMPKSAAGLADESLPATRRGAR